ncbi:hypothetical protein SAMN05443144_10173 [Fodinibius roseus]|uniref:Uncharacterized protein n=1 Tax=Fodinibius roseus TaxID=1194090 RepID=A0A1M4SM84_9BACT|nr:hypothetical protein SAMN05443144_10173 [Fodinibius roseus]
MGNITHYQIQDTGCRLEDEVPVSINWYLAWSQIISCS